jgi:hypothetical protein
MRRREISDVQVEGRPAFFRPPDSVIDEHGFLSFAGALEIQIETRQGICVSLQLGAFLPKILDPIREIFSPVMYGVFRRRQVRRAGVLCGR